MTLFDNFTERAKKVLYLAQEEAVRFNHNYIGTEHILLGLVREGDGVAARVLNNMGVQLPKLRAAVEFIIGRGEGEHIGEIGLTPRAKKVLELAVDEGRRLNHDYIGTEHLLLGLVREGEGIAAGVLESLGVNLEKVRAQVMGVVSTSERLPTNYVSGKRRRRSMVRLLQKLRSENALGLNKIAPNLPEDSALKLPDNVALSLGAGVAWQKMVEEASIANCKLSDTDHLLIGLARSPGTVASRYLGTQNVTEAELSQARVYLNFGERTPTSSDSDSLTEEMLIVCKVAVLIAQESGRKEVNSIDLLRAHLSTHPNRATALLSAIPGVSLVSIRDDLDWLIAGSASDGNSQGATVSDPMQAVPPQFELERPSALDPNVTDASEPASAEDPSEESS